MRKTYRILAYLIAAEVMVQAAAIAFAMAGELKYIDDGGVINKEVIDSHSAHFTGVLGFPIHGINGQLVIPLLALILLIVSFFARVPGGRKWAGAVVGLVVLQVALGLTLHGIPAVAPLHGINALLLFSAALRAGYRTRQSSAPMPSPVGPGAEPRVTAEAGGR